MYKTPKQKAKELVEGYMEYAYFRSDELSSHKQEQVWSSETSKRIVLKMINEEIIPIAKNLDLEFSTTKNQDYWSDVCDEVDEYDYETEKEREEEENELKKKSLESEIRIDMTEFVGTYTLEEAKEVSKRMKEKIEQATKNL